MSALSSWRDKDVSAHPVVVTYVVKPGKEAEFEEALGRHWPLLNDLGLVVPRPAVLLRSRKDRAVYQEIFAWNDQDAAAGAAQLPDVQELEARLQELTEKIESSDWDAV